MSESKAVLLRENTALRKTLADESRRLIHLLAYVMEQRDEHPEIEWPDLPDTYSETTWMFVG